MNYPEKSGDALTVLRSTRKLRQPAPGFYSGQPPAVTDNLRARLADLDEEAWTIAVRDWRLPDATPMETSS